MNRCNSTSSTQYNNHPRGGRMHTQWLATSCNQLPAPESQVPIRAHADAPVPCFQERTDQLRAYKMIDAHMQSSLLPQQHGTRCNSAVSAERLANTLASRRGVEKNMDSAFYVYGDRLKTDLRHFSQVCRALVRQEQLEKERWRRFSAMAVKERDDARVKLNLMTSTSRPASPPNALKRERDASLEDHTSLASISSSPQCAVDRYSSTPPPISAESNDPHTPVRTHSAPPFGMLPPVKGADGPPPKRRRSYDLSGARSPLSGIPSPAEKTHPRYLVSCRNPTSAPTLPSDFAHVDLMYAKENGSLVCRACTFAPLKVQPTSTKVKPKVFPLSASWDELRAHCRTHPDECMDIARLHPADLFELRRRFNFIQHV